MTRPPHKRGTPASKRGLSAEQIPVLVCRDRSGCTSDYVLEKDDAGHISFALKPWALPRGKLALHIAP